MNVAHVREQLLTSLKVTPQERAEIAALPQGSDRWLSSRRFRVTASIAGAAVGHSPYTTPISCAKALAQIENHEPGMVGDTSGNSAAAQLRQNRAFAYGHKHEPTALACYLSALRRQTNEPCAVSHVGLVIDVENPWLGASPDAIIGGAFGEDDANGNPLCDDLCVEIKCPKSGRVFEVCPAQYYDQMQVQMAILGKHFCDLVCWTPRRMNVWRYAFDPVYWSEFLLPGLRHFYFDVFLPMYCEAVVQGRAPPPPV